MEVKELDLGKEKVTVEEE